LPTDCVVAADLPLKTSTLGARMKPFRGTLGYFS
jgi:hypothetical protein